MSKKQRRAKSRKNAKASRQNKRRSNPPDVPSSSAADLRVMESTLQQLIGNAGLAGGAVEEALQLMYEAFEAADPRRQVQLAERALDISPDCADACVLLAEYAETLDEALFFYEQGVAAGRRTLGEEGFREFAGHFWGFLETRPYMRARAGLADALWAFGRQEEAVGHYQEMLQLNPNDNQGMRYRLAAALFDLERHEELANLLADYEQDDLAEWSYTRALLAFRQEGESSSAADLLRNAYQTNTHVPAYLTGDKALPRELPDYISPGREDEAAAYATQYLPAWKHSPGAITWLRKTLQLKQAAPRPQAAPPWDKVRPVLDNVPQTDATWELDLVGLGSAQEGKVWILAVADAATGELLRLDTKEARPKDSEVWHQLLRVIHRPDAGDASRPRSIQVRRKTFWRLWRSKLAEIGIDCQLTETLPRIDSLADGVPSFGDLVERVGVDGDAHGDFTDISTLPQQAGEVWQADVRQLEAWVSIGGQPQRPWIVLVASVTEDLIYTMDLADTPPPNWLEQGIQKAICQPAIGPPHRPGVIEVDSEKKRQLLASQLDAAGVRCVVAQQLTHWDEVMAGLTDHLAGASGPRPLVDSPGVTEDILGGFFSAAAEFYRQAPWRSIPGDTIIKVECDALNSGPWFAVVMGQSGMTLGLALYEDLDLLGQILNGQASDEENSRRSSALSMTYGEEFEFAPKDLDAIQKHGWPIAGPEAYPMVMRVNPGLATRVPLNWELELLRGCLQSIPPFIRAEQQQVDTTSSGENSSGARPLTLKLSLLEEE